MKKILPDYSGRTFSILNMGFIIPIIISLISFLIIKNSIEIYNEEPLVTLFGITFFFIFIGLLFFSKGLEINFKLKQYRYYTIYIFKFGKWKPLPLITSIMLKGVTEHRRVYGRSTSSVRASEKFYDVRLMFKTKRGENYIIAFRSKDINESKKEAEFLHKKLILENK